MNGIQAVVALLVVTALAVEVVMGQSTLTDAVNTRRTDVIAHVIDHTARTQRQTTLCYHHHHHHPF